MIHKLVLIASSKAPKKDKWDELVEIIRGLGAETRVTVGKVGVTDGPGCANYVIECEAEDEEAIERLATTITMAVFPAQWTYTSGEVPDGYTLDDPAHWTYSPDDHAMKVRQQQANND